MASHTGDWLPFQEIDEADQPIVSYVYSEQNVQTSTQAVPSIGRVDVTMKHCAPAATWPEPTLYASPSGASSRSMAKSQNPSSTALSWSTKPLISSLGSVFLPTGYPQSVSDDYLPYQIFDSLQAFCSSIAGLLSSRAVLQGVGVGNADASPTSALLLHILQVSSGRIATILFAHRVGTALEPECKTYRLAADVFNDIAMILDCLSPMVPGGVMRVSVLSTAGVLRALCGVAGGSSKASLSAHFAKWGNLAELNAKDSSQETVISLVGMLVGSVVVSRVSGFTTTWVALLVLLALHLSLNYAAVRSVQMTSLNRQRANIVFSALLDSDPDFDLGHFRSGGSKTTKAEASASQKRLVLTPAQVAQQEHIFHRDGALEWTSAPGKTQQQDHLGTAMIGVSLPTFFQNASHDKFHTSPSFQTPIPMKQLTSLFANESYLLFLSPASRKSHHKTQTKWQAAILLKRNCPVQFQLKAWMHALLAARVLSAHTPPPPSSMPESTNSTQQNTENPESVCTILARTLDFLNHDSRFETYASTLSQAGWAMNIAALETRGGRRVTFSPQE